MQRLQHVWFKASNETMLPFSISVLLYVHRDYKDHLGHGAQDGHREFRTAPELCDKNSSSVLLNVHGAVGDGEPSLILS